MSISTPDKHGSHVESHEAKALTESDVLGISICPSCHVRFKVQQKYKALVGRVIKCPKCHNDFALTLESPTPVERAAIANAQHVESDSQSSAPKRKKRTKSQIKRHHLRAIKKTIQPYHARLAKLAADEKCTEEDIRLWCCEVLKEVLGHEADEIKTELNALSKKIDIALGYEDEVFMVIECKNPRCRLPIAATNQAVMYAANKSVEWAAVTNGQVWRLFHVTPKPGHDPDVTLVFNISLLDKDGVSDADIESLYLLTNRALKVGDTTRRFHEVASTSNERLLEAMATPRVVKAMRRSLNEIYQNAAKFNPKLTEDFIETRLQAMLAPADLTGTTDSEGDE